MRIDLRDRHSSEAPALEDLAAGWDTVPVASASVEYGTRWAREIRSLVLDVPSALVREERNAVLNPKHPQCAGVRLAIEREFHYDQRMFVPRSGPRRA